MMKKKVTVNLLNSLQIDVSNLTKIVQNLDESGIRNARFIVDEFYIESSYKRSMLHASPSVNCIFDKVIRNDQKIDMQCSIEILLTHAFRKKKIAITGSIIGNCSDDSDYTMMNSIYSYLSSIIEIEPYFSSFSEKIILPNKLERMYSGNLTWQESLRKNFVYTKTIDKIYDTNLSPHKSTFMNKHENDLNYKYNAALQKSMQKSL